MNKLTQSVLIIGGFLLLFNQSLKAMNATSLIEAVSHSQVPPEALRDALTLHQRLYQTSRLFRFFELSPLENQPNALGFFDNTIEAILPTVGEGQYIVIFDLNRHSSTDRLHIIDMTTGSIDSVQAAHGVESDCGGQRVGFACKFISDRESKASPLGFFVTGETYKAKSGPAIRLNGLESKSVGFLGNDVASTIIIHQADYVQAGRRSGLSWGCPAMNPKILERVKNKLPAGTLFYFYHSSLNFTGRNPIVQIEN